MLAGGAGAEDQGVQGEHQVALGSALPADQVYRRLLLNTAQEKWLPIHKPPQVLMKCRVVGIKQFHIALNIAGKLFQPHSLFFLVDTILLEDVRGVLMCQHAHVAV